MQGKSRFSLFGVGTGRVAAGNASEVMCGLLSGVFIASFLGEVLNCGLNQENLNQSLRKASKVSTRDSNGNELADGDSVQVIKDLKVKGASMTLKRGTTYKNIRLTSKEGEIECRQGKSTIVLKTCFLKKA